MLKRFGSCQKGAAAVEFALLLFPLVLITFGIIEFGLLLYNQQILTNASREGARAGIVLASGTPLSRLLLNVSGEVCSDVPTPSIDCVVQNYCANYLVTFDDTKPRPTTTCPVPISTTPPITQGYSETVLADTGDNLGVVVKYEYKFLVPKIFPFVTGGKKTLTAVTVMRYE